MAALRKLTRKCQATSLSSTKVARIQNSKLKVRITVPSAMKLRR